MLLALFAEHGLGAYINSTRSLVVLLSDGGRGIACNPPFDVIKQNLPETKFLRDVLSLSSRNMFDLLLSNLTHDDIQTQGELDLGQGNQLSGYACFLYPVPDVRVIFIAEPTHAVSDLVTVSAELQMAKQILARKEIELQSVLEQATQVPHTV